MMDREIEVFRVVRKPPMGKLVVEVNSTKYEKLSEVPPGNLKQRILAAIGDLVVFVDGYDTLVRAGMAPPVSGTNSAGQPYASSVEARQSAFRSELERQRYEAQLKSQTQKISVENEQKAVSSSATGINSELSMVDQIDIILQRYLAEDPALRGRIAHLESAPGGGLRIRVDSSYYSQPKDIEDGRIRRAIMLALREWEAGE
jgi:hypothetical protein